MDHNDWKYNNRTDSGRDHPNRNHNDWKNDIKNGWKDTGNQIKEMVDTAIHSGNFEHLNNSVSNMVNDTITMVKTNLNSTIPYLNQRQGQASSNSANANSDPKHDFQKQTQNTDSQAQTFHKRAQNFYAQMQNPDNRTERSHTRTQNTNARSQNIKARTQNTNTRTQNTGARMQTFRKQPQSNAGPALYAKNPPGRVAGILMTVFGFLIMVTFLLFVIGFGIAGAVWHLFLIPVAACSVLTVIGLALGICGIRQLALDRRFEQYIFKLRGHISIPVQSLAEQTGKSVEFTARDLKKMIRCHFFYQAHLDEDENYFILSDKAWKDYMAEKEKYAARRKEQEKEKAAEKLSEECQKIMDDGQKYIYHIHTCNDLISNGKISQKLDRMEQVIIRIFEEVRKRPETASDLQQMMDYYLPTTSKLLDAYRDLDSQPIEGENISSTKREISDTLDTLNTAFEKLLDSLFLNRAWDISSDISVLNTVLAQEGLVENDFQKETEIEKYSY
ncbi:MAG: hypothetical protein HFG80_05710 [Eubacterium sp.]|nr:hypothetical protein [Eubacterium sp.]